MEIMVPMPLSVMVGAVLGPAVEAFVVGALVPSLDPIVESFVSRVIAGMSIVILMSEAGCRGNAQDQDTSRQYQFANGHRMASLTERSVSN